MLSSEIHIPSPLFQIHVPAATKRNIRVYLKRDDLIHPVISGNKWRKLKYNLREANKLQLPILTFGGAWSNHIHAIAAAGSVFHHPTIGIIRGERPHRLSRMLADSEGFGMKLKFVSRTDYRNKNNPDFLIRLFNEFGDYYLLPEGGQNHMGVQGCSEIIGEIDINFDYLVLACGTGTTIAGLLNARSGKEIIGLSVLKNGQFLEQEVRKMTDDKQQEFRIETRYDFGGYAKSSPELEEFIIRFYNDHQILLDPVYTGKMMFGLLDMISNNEFPPDSTIVAIHTGGLQGIAGFPDLHRKLFTKQS